MSGKKSLSRQNAVVERISIAGLESHVAPLALLNYAKEFARTAKIIPSTGERFEPARNYLACHAVELALKGFLSLAGVSMLELAGGPYGHDLEAILEATEAKNLNAHVLLTAEHKKAIREASEDYAGKVFEYPALGKAFVGDPGTVNAQAMIEIAELIVESLRPEALRR